jgi:hypothetical protein
MAISPSGGARRLLGGARRRDADETQQQHRRDGKRDQGEISAHESRRQELDRDPARRGTEDAADQAAGEHQRDRSRPEVAARDIGRGEAVVLAVGVVDAENQRGEAEQPETLQPYR